MYIDITGHIIIATLGAMMSATLGGILNRLFFKIKYNILVSLWILSLTLVFGIQFVIFFQIVFGIRVAFEIQTTFGGNFALWMLIALGCAPGSMATYFLNRDSVIPADNEHPWRIGCGMFLLLLGTGITMTFNWWVQGSYDIFHQYAYVAVLLCILVQAGAGLSALLWSKDNNN